MIGCFTLNKSSEISTDLTLLQAAGARYRVRADYARSGGDATNLNTDGSWFYFEVVKLAATATAAGRGRFCLVRLSRARGGRSATRPARQAAQ